MTNSGISYRIRNKYEMQLNLKGIKINTIVHSAVSGLYLLITDINFEGWWIGYRIIGDDTQLYSMMISTFLGGEWKVIS